MSSYIVFGIEVLVVLLIIARQYKSYRRNQKKISELKESLPEAGYALEQIFISKDDLNQKEPEDILSNLSNYLDDGSNEHYTKPVNIDRAQNPFILKGKQAYTIKELLDISLTDWKDASKHFYNRDFSKWEVIARDEELKKTAEKIISEERNKDKGLYKFFCNSGYISQNTLDTLQTENRDLYYKLLKFPPYFLTQNKDAKVRIKLLKYDSDDKLYQKIQTQINLYLISSKGESFNLPLVKDIIEGYTNLRDEDITLTINNPLFYGLMATMIGIIFGLVNLFSQGNQIIEGNVIYLFLINIAITMVSSVLGVALTVTSSSGISETQKKRSYKESKKELDKRKTEFYNYIQIHYATKLKNDTAIILDSLKDNFSRFNDEMKENIDSFSESINGLKQYIIEDFKENITKQNEVLQNLKKVDLGKLAESNIKVMEKFSSASENFNKINEYLNKLSDFIANTNKLSGNSIELFQEIKNFKEAINSNIQQITNQLTISNRVVQYLDSHSQELESRNNAIKILMDKVDSNIKSGIGNLDEKIINEKGNVKKAADEIDQTIRESLRNLKIFTSKAIDELHSNLKKEEKKVEQLLHDSKGALGQLEHLETIDQNIQKLYDSNELRELSKIKEIENVIVELKNSISKDNSTQLEVLNEIKKLNSNLDTRLVQVEGTIAQLSSNPINKEEKSFQGELLKEIKQLNSNVSIKTTNTSSETIPSKEKSNSIPEEDVIILLKEISNKLSQTNLNSRNILLEMWNFMLGKLFQFLELLLSKWNSMFGTKKKDNHVIEIVRKYKNKFTTENADTKTDFKSTSNETENAIGKILYVTTPENGVFTKFSEKHNGDSSYCYRLEIINDIYAYYTIITNKKVLSSPNSYIEPGCDIISDKGSTEINNVVVIRKGQAIFQNGKWIIQSKIQVKLE